MNNGYILGLDIGIGSVGWSLIDYKRTKLKDFGVRIFDQANPASEPRTKRSARRNLRRKKWRKEQLKNLFSDFGIIASEEINQQNYLSYTYNSENIKRPEPDTVYHLRKKALEEKVSKREILLALYNISQARGHFLMEDIDFSKDSVSFEMFKDKFMNLSEKYIEIINDRKEDFCSIVLKPLYEAKLKQSDIKGILKNNSFVEDENKELGLFELVKLVAGYKGDLHVLDNGYESKSENVTSFKKADSLTVLQEQIVDLYDLISISSILNDGFNYLCEAAVNNLDNFKDYYVKDQKLYEDEIKKIKNKMSGKKHVRPVRNLDNSFPNGMYVKEARAILRKQQEYYPEISDEFIEIASSILSSRIPYYIGPLSIDAKNSWVVKNNNFKYSYQYSLERMKAVDEDESIKRWKKKMISHCTYLPENEALPKGSFIGETFSIINELNNFVAEDKDGNSYCLTQKDKIRIFNELFLIKDKVSTNDIKELLGFTKFGTKNSKQTKINNQYTIVKNLFDLMPGLRVENITDLFRDKEKIKRIEDIILDINLFDEEISKRKHFEKGEYSSVARQLSKLKSTSFYSLSKEFIMETKMDENGSSLMDKLFEDNSLDYTNNMMYIINNVFDENGEKIDFISNKYLRKFQDGCDLDIELLIDNQKPLIPVSRAVIRSLNECMKMYKAIIELYGIPERVVIETARGKDAIKDFSDEYGVPEKHAVKIENLCTYLDEQLKKLEKDKNFFKSIKFEDIKEKYENNKEKIELYIRQDGIDLLTGEQIELNRLYDYEIDHILPRGFGDDSMDDKMLTLKKANAKKADRTPIEFLESPDAIEFTKITTSRYADIVDTLFSMRLISENKRDRLMLASKEEAGGFINRNLVDTRYIIREFMAIINAYNQTHDIDTHLVAMKAAFTNVYRNALGFAKNRDLGDQHHVIDASVVALADRMLSTYYPHYDERGNFDYYQKFINEYITNTKKSGMEDKNDDNGRAFILHSYYKAFNESSSTKGSLVSQIKETTPLYSIKTEKNWKGRFFEETIHKQPLDEGNPLTIIGVNDSKKIFSGIECVAVDFYKYKDKKGNRKHLAVHIPKVIVNANGIIDKVAYLKLIKDYYKVPELIDENGELATNFFRLRAFRNDIIYDTSNYVPQLFNIGSMVNKKLDLKHIYCFSYDDIYTVAKKLKYKIIGAFNIKTANNKNGVEFKQLNKKIVIDYAIDFLGLIDIERYKETIMKRTEKENNINNFCQIIVYLVSVANRKNTPKTIDGQNALVANNSSFSSEDTQYIKLKYSYLGVRFSNSKNNKLIIEGPKQNIGAYSKINKEEFSWKISKYSVE